MRLSQLCRLQCCQDDRTLPNRIKTPFRQRISLPGVARICMQLHATADTRNLSPKNMCEVLPSARLLRVAEMITKNTNEVYASLFGGSRPSGKTCPKLYRFFTALDRKLCQKPSSLRVDCSGPVAQIGKACCLEAQAPRALELVAFSSQNHGLAESRPSRILHLGTPTNSHAAVALGCGTKCSAHRPSGSGIVALIFICGMWFVW